MERGENGYQKTTSETKFDQYFMYGIDVMNDDGSHGGASCGPNTGRVMCKEMANSQDTCCTHVVMQEDG